MNKIEATDPEAQSADLVADNIAQLKALFPELITEGADGVAVNVDVLKQLVGDATVSDAEEKYGLNWHGKHRARQLALTPSTGTLRPCPEDSVDWDTTQNLMIEGDNLEVLKLLQKSYAGKVKLIYIDPPYNTGKDFVYPDNFQDSIKSYMELTGQVEGGSKISSNTEASGRYHTDWLNMMYPRLLLARNLLSKNGVIAVSIGQDEISGLSQACFDLYGEENLLTICSRVMKTGGQKGTYFSPCVDYILLFAKDVNFLDSFREQISQNVIDKVYTKIQAGGPRNGEKFRSMGLYQAMLDKRANQRYYIECPDGELVIPPGARFPSGSKEGDQVTPGDDDGVWRWTYKRFADEKNSGNIEFIRSDKTSLVKPDGSQASWNVYYKIWLKDRLEEGQLPGNILEKFESRHSSAELKALDIPFDFAKPVQLIKFLMSVTGVKDGDLTLDFFAGSGTTGHSAYEMAAESNARFPFICVQLPEPTDPDSAEFKAGYRTIAEITKERLRRAGAKTKGENPLFTGDAGFRVYKLDQSSIRAWQPSGDLEKDLVDSVEHIIPGRSEQDVLTELLLKLGLDLCVPIEQRQIAGKTVHAIGGGVLMACLDPRIGKDDAELLALGIAEWHAALAPAGDTTCVFRDSAFENDEAKTNLAAILEQHGIHHVRSL